MRRTRWKSRSISAQNRPFSVIPPNSVTRTRQIPPRSTGVCVCVCVCRWLAVGRHHVRLAVPSLLCTELEPTSGLFACWVQDDVGGGAWPVSAPDSPVLAAGDWSLCCYALLGRDYVDVCRGLTPCQYLPALSGL